MVLMTHLPHYLSSTRIPRGVPETALSACTRLPGERKASPRATRATARFPSAVVDSISPPTAPYRKHVVHVIFAADVSGSLEDVVSQDDAVRGHRAFLMRELEAITLHPPIQRFLRRWQPGDPAAYLGEMWVV